jgi:hypothetical protein
MTTRDDFLVAPTATALPDAPSIAPSEDVDSVYVQDEQQQNKEEKPAAVTIQEPVQDNEYIEDMFDDNETLGSMSVMFAEAKSKGRKEPEGNYVPPSHHTYDQDDAMTMGSLASVFSAKQKQAVRKGKRHNAARATGDPIMIPDCQERSVRTALSSTNAAVGPPVDDEDNNTLGGLSGIIGGVNLMEVQQEQHSEKDEETGVMYEYPMKDGSDGTEKSDGSSKKAHFGVNVSFFNRRYSSRRKKIAYCCTCSALVALIAMAVILGVRSLHNRQQVNVPVPAEATAAPIPDKTPPPTTRPPVAPGETTSPTTSPTVAPTVTPTINYIDPLLEFLQDSQVVFDKDPTSPQYMAVQWLAQEANDLEQPLQYDAKLLQRYALLALDFGLGRMLPSNTQTSAPNVVVGFNGTMFANETEMNVTTAITRIGGDVIQDDLPLYMTQNTIAIAGLDECEWERVFCGNGTNAEMVEEIRFSYSMLSGTIAPEIHLLRNTLKVLDLAGNDLQGSIPETLYDLDILEELYLYQNNLTGTLSSKIGNWNNMTRLHLSHNRLNGPIPEALKSASVARPLRTSFGLLGCCIICCSKSHHFQFHNFHFINRLLESVQQPVDGHHP